MSIGSVRVTGAARTPYVQTNADGGINALGQVSDALSRVARRLEVDELKLAEEDRRSREQSENFNAATRWTEKQGEWARTQTDFLAGAPADGAGITEQRFGQLRADRDAFVATLPPRLREEYIARTEATLQDFTTNTYSQEYKLRFDYQTDALTKTAGGLAGEIRAGRATMESSLAEFDEVLSQSALPEATRLELRDKMHGEFAAAQFARITQDALERPQAVQTKAGDIALSGVTPSERGMLNAIAKRESAGKYNIRYTPKGGVTFDGYADHPRIFERTKDGKLSSAAGRYQFTAQTWDDLVNRYGRSVLPDFSPASQDKGALILARERYHMGKSKDMRSFEELMRDGTDEELIKMKQILGGTGNKTTWQAFQFMSNQEFINVFRGQEGVAGGGTGSAAVPDVWTDPRFAGLDYDTKMSLAGQAQQAVNAINAAAEAQKKQFSDLLKANIALGSAGMKEVDDAIAKNMVPAGDYDALIKLVDKERQAAVAAKGYGEAISSGTPVENSKENRDAASKFMQQAGITDGLRKQSPEARAQLSELFAAGGILPDDISGLVDAMARSADPRQVTYAMDLLSDMRAKNSDMFAAVVGKEMAELEGVWSIAKKYSPMGDTGAAIEMLKNFRDPAQAAFRATMRKEAQKQLEEISDKQIEKAFDDTWFSSRPAMPMSPQSRAVLRTDFSKLYETYYPMFGDPGKTTEFVVGQMKHSWGVDEVAGKNRLMYLGPTSAVSGYAPIEGSYDWIREDLLSGMGWDENVEFELIADGQTESDIASRKPASYIIVRKGDDGQFRTEFTEDGAPMRVRFTQSPEIIQSQREKVLERNLTERLRRLESETDTRHVDPSQHKLGDQSAIEATKNELEELRQQRKDREAGKRFAPENPMTSFEQNFNIYGEEN